MGKDKRSQWFNWLLYLAWHKKTKCIINDTCSNNQRNQNPPFYGRSWQSKEKMIWEGKHVRHNVLCLPLRIIIRNNGTIKKTEEAMMPHLLFAQLQLHDHKGHHTPLYGG